MHPLMNSQLANQHQTELQHEAEMVRLASQVTEQKRAERTRRHQPVTFLSLRSNMTKLSSRQAVVIPESLVEEVPFAELRPALQATFSVLHEVGLISDYDDTFMEQFNETFERELVHQVQCHSVSQ